MTDGSPAPLQHPVSAAPARGVFAMLGACTIWGLSPLFYAQLSHVPPQEVLAQRTLWSLVFFALVLAISGRLVEVPRAIRGRRGFFIALGAALLISVNWFLFIFAIQVGRTVEASLGYYIYPLVAVLIGALVLRETLGAAQRVAVLIAAVAVLVLTLGLGAAPWISLTLASTFGLYGLLKRWGTAGPVVSVTAEVLLLAPLAAAYLIWLGVEAGAFGTDWTTSILLILSGPLTAIPLILFSYAARRVAMATVGLLQYINPTLQFALAATILGDTITRWHMIAFPMIWAALALYSWATLRRAPSRARA